MLIEREIRESVTKATRSPTSKTNPIGDLIQMKIKALLLSAVAMLCLCTSAMAEYVEYINLSEPARQLFFPVGQQNIIELSNPTNEGLTFDVGDWDVQAYVPAGRTRRIYINRQDNPSRRVTYRVYNENGGCASRCGQAQVASTEIVQNRATALLQQSFAMERAQYEDYSDPEPVMARPVVQKKIIRGYW